jgi:putative transposase
MGMIDTQDTRLSTSAQCRLLDVPRSSFYYRPKETPAEDERLMRFIDEQYLATPFYGSRRMTRELRLGGFAVNRKRVQRLMATMGICAVYPRPRTSKPHPEHRVYPYLLRDLAIDRPGQVWCADVTYIPMRRGFMYLVAIMDWHSRRVLSFRLSNTLDADFCVEALREALDRHGAPAIFNTDQGAQFTSERFTGVLREHSVRISMDGRGRYLDNIFIERLWWSLKYECVYLHEYADARELSRGITHWFGFYNTKRGHSALGGCTPDDAYFTGLLEAA